MLDAVVICALFGILAGGLLFLIEEFFPSEE